MHHSLDLLQRPFLHTHVQNMLPPKLEEALCFFLGVKDTVYNNISFTLEGKSRNASDRWSPKNLTNVARPCIFAEFISHLLECVSHQ